MLFQFQKTNSLIFTGWMMANQVSIIFCRTFLHLAKLTKHNIMSLFKKKFDSDFNEIGNCLHSTMYLDMR